jgi:hypothetical protein
VRYGCLFNGVIVVVGLFVMQPFVGLLVLCCLPLLGGSCVGVLGFCFCGFFIRFF